MLTMKDIYINFTLNPLTKFICSKASFEFKDLLPWNISQAITETVPMNTKKVINYEMKQYIPFWVWQKVKGNWGNNVPWFSQWRQNHCRRNTNIRRNKYIQKSRTVRVRAGDPSRKINHLSKVMWDRKIITELTRSISSTRIHYPVLMMDIKVPKDKHIRIWVDREKLIYVRLNKSKSHA